MTETKTTQELSLLYDQLHRLEAYKELVDRRAHGDMSAERARTLVLTVTEDEEEADRTYSNIKFATTPY